MKYVNRRGFTYYVFQGVTKTGKPKYYVSLKPESVAGIQIDSLPADFELFESPIDARVSIRKRVPLDIYDNELRFVQERTNSVLPKALGQRIPLRADVRWPSRKRKSYCHLA